MRPDKVRWGTRGLSIFVLLPVAVAALACSSGANHATSDAGADSGGDGAVVVPASAAGRALEWVLATLNGVPRTEVDVNERFSAGFLAQVTPAQLRDVLAQLSSAKPWVLVDFEPAPAPTNSLTAVVTRFDGQYWRIFLAVDAPGKMTGLLLQPAGDLDPTLATWDSLERVAATIAPNVNLLAARVDGAACVPIRALGAGASMAIGSTFKLWVLAALADDIRAANHTWEDTVPIEDAHKSLPSGVLQDEPAGTRLSLLQFANQMISISDNTATDHLLFFLGRDAVEAAVVRSGHHAPAQNQPFLATRELFNLKLMVTPAEQQAYIAGTIAERRALLPQYESRYDPRTFAGPDPTGPIAIDTLEWFATPGDLCNVMRALKVYGDQPATRQVHEVLALNPGIADLSGTYEYVGFKGGSEPGVLNLTWLLRRRVDQSWLFLTIGFNDPARDIDQEKAAYIAGAARALLGKP